MRVKKAILVPALVVAATAVGGGWLLQSDGELGANLYFRTRLLDEVVDRIDDHFVDEVDVDGLYRAAVQGVVDQLGDRNSAFLEAAVWEDVRIRTEGEYGGIGLEVADRDGFVTVVARIPGTPAARAGLRPGDRIVEVAGESVRGRLVDQVAGRLRGEPGTPVRVGIERPGGAGVLNFEVDRALIHYSSVPFATMLDDEVGYVPLDVFNGRTTADVRAAVDSLRSVGMRALILDLRRNAGGLLSEGVALADLFLDPDEDIVEIRGRSSPSEKRVARSEQAYPDLPLVALVGHGSASASEILAGALQDHDRALLVGSTTFGKGSVQSLFPLSGGNVLKLTTARWYTPSGRSIQRDASVRRERLSAGPLALDGERAMRPDVQGRPRFVSRGGRAVLGGGGVVPDVWAMPDTLTAAERGAVERIFGAPGGPFGFFAGLHGWAVSYLQRNPDAPADFDISDADLESFWRALRRRAAATLDESAGAAGVAADPEGPTWADLERARRYVVHHMEAEVALQARDDLGRFQRTWARDAQLRRAMELISGARDQTALFEAAGSPLASASAAGRPPSTRKGSSS